MANNASRASNDHGNDQALTEDRRTSSRSRDSFLRFCGPRALGLFLRGFDLVDDRLDVAELDALFAAVGGAVDDGDDVEVVDGDLQVAVLAAGGGGHLDLGA